MEKNCSSCDADIVEPKLEETVEEKCDHCAVPAPEANQESSSEEENRDVSPDNVSEDSAM